MGGKMTSLELVNEARESGLYPIADLKLFETLENIKICNNVKDNLLYVTDELYEYLDKINEFTNTKPGLKELLSAFKTDDTFENQKLEKENPFLVGLFLQTKKEKAIDKLIKIAKTDKELTRQELLSIHNALLYGTSSENNELIRKNNNTFVGYFMSEDIHFDFFPIDYHEINNAIKKLLDLYNNRLDGAFDNVFIQPFAIHGLLGALQLFNDGNTRLGRLMQHVLLWKLINEKTEYTYDNPPIYATKTYIPLREKYRNLIIDIVKYNDNDIWNEWFNFNLFRIEDQIYKNNENIEVLKRRIK